MKAWTETKRLFHWLNTDPDAPAVVLLVIAELFTKPFRVREKVTPANTVAEKIKA